MSGDALEGLLTVGHSDNKRYKILRLSSKERVSGTAYDFVCNFGNDGRLDNCQEVHLMNVSVPNIAYNISAGNGNNSFDFTAGISGPQSILFTDGFYSTSQVIDRLESEINLAIAPASVVITQNEFTKRLVFTVTGDTIDVNGGSGLALTMGFTEQTGAFISLMAPSLPSLNGGTVIYIHSEDLANNITYLNSTTGNIVDVNGSFTVPVNVPFGAYQTYQGNEETDRQVYGRVGKSLKRIRITLRGNGGRLLTELSDSFETVIVLKVFW